MTLLKLTEDSYPNSSPIYIVACLVLGWKPAYPRIDGADYIPTAIFMMGSDRVFIVKETPEQIGEMMKEAGVTPPKVIEP